MGNIRPTRDEILSHFKNAITVQCTNDSDAYYLDWSQDLEFYSDSVRILNQKDEPYSGTNTFCQLWSKSKGYAKILTYKTKQMKISKNQIKGLYEEITVNPEGAKLYLKEKFPEAFKVDYNEPLLSLNDLLSVWGNPNEIELYKTALLFKDFEKLAEQKLKDK